MRACVQEILDPLHHGGRHPHVKGLFHAAGESREGAAVDAGIDRQMRIELPFGFNRLVGFHAVAEFIGLF
jgi:hypothetical protein